MSKTPREIIPIFYAIDNDYAKFAAISIKSLLMNASPNYDYHIHVVFEDIDDDNAQILRSLATNHAQIFLDPMQQSLDMITDRIGNYLRASVYTLTIYFRIFIPQMFPEYDRCIYLDSDTVILGDISRLWCEDIGDNYMGCIIDNSIVTNEILATYTKDVIGVPVSEYVNSGVLLMNAQKLRELQLGDRFLQLYDKYELDVIAPDQDYLNALCYGHIQYLPEIYDAMPNPDRPEQTDPVIVHYNLFFKPWHYDHVQYDNYFWEYARLTPYYDQIKELRSHYTAVEQQRDQNAMELMLERATAICRQPLTFKQLFESGQEKRL